LHVHHHVSLQHRSRKPRGAQMAVVDSPEGKLVLVNFHLGLAETERRWQVRHLLGHKLLKDVSHLPTLITGDFNDWRNTLSRHAFRHHSFRQATAPTRRFRSFPAFFPLASLDKLFLRGAIHISHVHVLKNRLARQASDHLPLIADFNLHQDQKN